LAALRFNYSSCFSQRLRGSIIEFVLLGVLGGLGGSIIVLVFLGVLASWRLGG
jgi:hypothetical protein